MNKTVFFLNMFSDYQPPEPLLGMLSQAAITAADIDPEMRAVSVEISAETYIPLRLLSQAQTDVAAIYGLRKLQIMPVYPATQIRCMEDCDLMQLFVEENPIARGCLAGAKWEWEENTLHIHLTANGVDIWPRVFLLSSAD